MIRRGPSLRGGQAHPPSHACAELADPHSRSTARSGNGNPRRVGDRHPGDGTLVSARSNQPLSGRGSSCVYGRRLGCLSGLVMGLSREGISPVDPCPRRWVAWSGEGKWRCGMTGTGSTAPAGAGEDLLRRHGGETVLITGASSGIGRQLARQFAGDGAELVLIARSEDRLRELAGELTAEYGVTVEVVPADLSRPGSPDQIVETLAQRHIDVDVLV